jgi:hypothetical protein
MTFLVQMAPKGSEEEFIAEKLRGYGFLQKSQTLNEGLRRRRERGKDRACAQSAKAAPTAPLKRRQSEQSLPQRLAPQLFFSQESFDLQS